MQGNDRVPRKVSKEVRATKDDIKTGKVHLARMRECLYLDLPDMSKLPKRHDWTPSDSLFASRKRESDSRDFDDTTQLLGRAFLADWQTKVFKIVKAKADYEAVCSIMSAKYELLREVFRFYACHGSGIASQIS